MTLEQLRVFVAVAERQHVTRAAEALNLAQSAVSATIAALEQRHGVKLFHRVGRGIELTEIGERFVVEARAVVARAEAAELVLSELGGLQRGTLRLAASQTIASYWLPRHLVAFRRAHPGIDIKLVFGNTAQVAATVEDGVAELGFVEGIVDNPLLDSCKLARDQIILLVGPDHPWTAQTDIDATDLTQTAWVLREPGSGTRAVLETALAAQGVSLTQLEIALELPSNEAVRAAVEAGMGATALSATVAAPSLEAGLLHHVPFALPERDFHVLRHTRRHRSLAGEALLKIIRG